jgi:hypothetical protein
MITLVACGGDDETAVAPLPVAQRFVTAEDAPGSKPDPVETPQATEDFEEFIRTLGDFAIDPDTEEMTAVFEEAGFEEVRTSLVPAPIVQPDAQAFQTFITTVICRPHLAHLASPALQEAFVQDLTRKASADNPPFELDYWRLNIAARRPAD